jgi:hypothetical protein
MIIINPGIISKKLDMKDVIPHTSGNLKRLPNGLDSIPVLSEII